MRDLPGVGTHHYEIAAPAGKTIEDVLPVDEDREGLRKIDLDPVGELQRCLPVAGDEACESPLCLGRAIGVEDAASVASSSEARPRLSFVPNRSSA